MCGIEVGKMARINPISVSLKVQTPPLVEKRMSYDLFIYRNSSRLFVGVG
jgi:hypothetical protein